MLKYWKEKNSCETEKVCTELLQKLEQVYFNPILVRLDVNDPGLTVADIMLAYDSIHQGYKAQARGSKSVRAKVFTDFHPVCINKRMFISSYCHSSFFRNVQETQIKLRRCLHVKHTFFYGTGNYIFYFALY